MHNVCIVALLTGCKIVNNPKRDCAIILWTTQMYAWNSLILWTHKTHISDWLRQERRNSITNAVGYVFLELTHRYIMIADTQTLQSRFFRMLECDISGTRYKAGKCMVSVRYGSSVSCEIIATLWRHRNGFEYRVPKVFVDTHLWISVYEDICGSVLISVLLTYVTSLRERCNIILSGWNQILLD